jgi:hypothetical protein
MHNRRLQMVRAQEAPVVVEVALEVIPPNMEVPVVAASAVMVKLIMEPGMAKVELFTLLEALAILVVVPGGVQAVPKPGALAAEDREAMV